MRKIKCEESCRYYDRRSMLCGFCMKKILEELEDREEEKEIDGRQDDFEGTE